MEEVKWAKYITYTRPVFCYTCGWWHISSVKVPRCGFCHRRTLIELPEIPKKIAEHKEIIRKLEEALNTVPEKIL